MGLRDSGIRFEQRGWGSPQRNKFETLAGVALDTILDFSEITAGEKMASTLHPRRHRNCSTRTAQSARLREVGRHLPAQIAEVSFCPKEVTVLRCFGQG